MSGIWSEAGDDLQDYALFVDDWIALCKCEHGWARGLGATTAASNKVRTTFIMGMINFK